MDSVKSLLEKMVVLQSRHMRMSTLMLDGVGAVCCAGGFSDAGVPGGAATVSVGLSHNLNSPLGAGVLTVEEWKCEAHIFGC